MQLNMYRRLSSVLFAGVLILGMVVACVPNQPANTAVDAPEATPTPTPGAVRESASGSATVAFTWHREGGIAGFCDDVTVDVAGDVVVSSCRGESPVEVARFHLDVTQQNTMSTWVDTFQPFQYERRDPAQADAMIVQLSFTGAGEQAAAEPDQALIVDFAQNLYNEGQMGASEPPAACTTPGDEQQLLVKEEHEYCLLYPAAYSLLQSGPDAIEIVVDTVMNHIDPRVSLTVEDANGRTLEEVVAQLIADSVQPGVAVDQNAITVAGAEAVMLDNLLGQDIYRRVALIHNGQLYSFFFAPIGEEGTATRQQAEALYQTVIDSFRFLAETAAQPNAVITPAPLPIPAAVEVTPTDVQYIQALENVNIRSGPGTNYGVVGSIAAGQVALVTGLMPDGGWWRVICPDDSVGNCFVVNDPSLTQPATAPGGQPGSAPEGNAPVPDTGETALYRDENAGFSFAYPSSWTVDGNTQSGARGYIVQLTSWAHAPGEITEETPPGGSRLDVSVLEWDPKHDLTAYLEVRKTAWAASGISIVSEETLQLTGDQSAVRFLITGPGSAEQALFLITTVGDRYLTLSGYGDVQALDTIAQSLQLQDN